MKEQTWVTGSLNINTEDKTDLQADNAWNPLEILKAGDLNGMLKKDSEQLKIVSDEIANLITNAGIELDPTDHTQLLEAINRIKSSSLQFKGYVATSAPSSSTYSLLEGNMWINSATMPTSFPVSASDIKIWNGTAWVTTTVAYTPEEFHTFRNINDGEGYYWFGGTWKVMSTDMSTDYFTLNQTTGLWEISSTYDNSLVHKAGSEIITGIKTLQAENDDGWMIKKVNGDITDSAPSVQTIGSFRVTDKNNLIMGDVRVVRQTDGSQVTGLVARNKTTGTQVDCSIGCKIDKNGNVSTFAPTPVASDNSTNIATTAYVKLNLSSYAPLASPALTGNPTAPTQTAGNNSTRIATTAFVTTAVSSAVAGNLKAGTIVPFGGSTTPSGYLQCNGAAVSRTTYADLFAAIGTTWGAGDGSTTFNVPNFTNAKMINSTATTLGVKGDGLSLGLTDGIQNTALFSGAISGNTVIGGATNGYGQPYGTTRTSSLQGVNTTLGVTTDATKSGIVADMPVTIAPTKWIIKY